MNRRRILVTGASGMLGSALVAAWRSRHDVIGAAGQVALPDRVDRQGDITDAAFAEALIAEAVPDLVVHSAAWTDVDGAEADPTRALRVNATASGRLARFAAQRGAAFVYISTEAVFDGRRGGYRETDVPQPINVYGESKLAGERETLAAHPGALVLRVGLEGWRPVGHPGFVQWVIEGLARGERRNIVTDWIHTPVFTANLATIIERLWAIGRRGILHVGTAEPASNWDMATEAVDAFGLDASLLTPVTSDMLSLRAARPRNVSLDTSELRRAVGEVVWSVKAGVRAMRDEEPAVRALQACLAQ